MAVFSKRSYQSEYLDRTDIPFEDIRRNMVELEVINKYLGGHAATLSGMKSILSKTFRVSSSSKPLLICEMGSGGGDNLNVIIRWCRKRNIPARFIGIDINMDCISYAKENMNMENVQWITSDYRQVRFKEKPDIIFSSLFCHHFKEDELVSQIRWMKENTTLGFFINDLHRHILAYSSIKLVTRIFSRSYLVKNDAPLSVLRGFSKREWIQLFQKAGLYNYAIGWKWAFRWLIVCKGGNQEF